jgi:hypothetical protein
MLLLSDYFFLTTITPISPKPMAIKLMLSGSGTDTVPDAAAWAPVAAINPINNVIFDSIFVSFYFYKC